MHVEGFETGWLCRLKFLAPPELHIDAQHVYPPATWRNDPRLAGNRAKSRRVCRMTDGKLGTFSGWEHDPGDSPATTYAPTQLKETIDTGSPTL